VTYRVAMIRERVMAEAIRMCKVMQVQFPHQFPDEADLYELLQQRGEHDLAVTITEAVMMRLHIPPSRVKEPRFNKTHRNAARQLKKTRGGDGAEL
jgi:hypothetical protein